MGVICFQDLKVKVIIRKLATSLFKRLKIQKNV